MARTYKANPNLTYRVRINKVSHNINPVEGAKVVLPTTCEQCPNQEYTFEAYKYNGRYAGFDVVCTQCGEHYLSYATERK